MQCLAGVPYDLTPDFLTELFTKHNIDYVVHGDDPCLLPDGTDAYAHAKKHGRFRMVGPAMDLDEINWQCHLSSCSLTLARRPLCWLQLTSCCKSQSVGHHGSTRLNSSRMMVSTILC